MTSIVAVGAAMLADVGHRAEESGKFVTDWWDLGESCLKGLQKTLLESDSEAPGSDLVFCRATMRRRLPPQPCTKWN